MTLTTFIDPAGVGRAMNVCMAGLVSSSRTLGLSPLFLGGRGAKTYHALMSASIIFNSPGLFITGTDTGVGKTAIACAIAWALRQRRPGAKIGVAKPFATDCRKERGGLVNEDTEALAHYADCRLPLDVINPVRFKPPLAPAMAAQQLGQPIDWPSVAAAMAEVDGYGDAVVVEGAGGLMVPLDPAQPRLTWLEMRCFGLPAVVVARAGLGTLNHTAMTVKLLKDADLPVAGVVINGYEPDEAAAMSDDPSRPGNPQWIAAMTGVPVLALVPRMPAEQVDPPAGVMPQALLESMRVVDWWRVMGG